MGKKGDAFGAFCDDEKAVKKWHNENNLGKLLGPRPPKRTKWINDMPGVLLSVKNFLPDEVAESASELLSQVPEESWNLLSGAADATNLDGINCAHRFHATVGETAVEGVDKLFELLSGVLPPGAHHLHLISIRQPECATFLRRCTHAQLLQRRARGIPRAEASTEVHTHTHTHKLDIRMHPPRAKTVRRNHFS